MSFIVVVVLTAIIIVYIDRGINRVFCSYVDTDVERITMNIVNSSIRNEYLITTEENKHNKNNDLYDTRYINELSLRLSKAVQDSLLNIEEGNIKDFDFSSKFKIGNYKYIKNGLLSEISIASIRGSSLFANIGPTIPIKLTFIGDVNVEIKTDIREYGINNVIVELDSIVKVGTQVSMPISSKRQIVEVKTPISIDIIKGDVPNYYNGVLH